jgi:hypothetical protein
MDVPVKHGTCLLGHFLKNGEIEPISFSARSILESMFSLGYELKPQYMHHTILYEYQIEAPPDIHLR